jgi:hypothetical protein
VLADVERRAAPGVRIGLDNGSRWALRIDGQASIAQKPANLEQMERFRGRNLAS